MADRYLWRDGELVPWDRALVHASTLGWSTMGAVFEGIKAYWNPDLRELYGWQFREHYERFANSMKMMCMERRFTPEQLTRASVELLRANDVRTDAYVRPLAWHADADWFGTLSDSSVSVMMWTTAFRSVLGSGRAIRACVSSWTRVSDNSLSPRIKCISNYQNSRMALLEATRNGYDQPILLNQMGKVTEGPASCIFIVREGVAITPSITSGVLESITRTTLLELCRDLLGIPVAEREIDRTELYIADEVFFCGTGAEVTPVAEVDGYTIGTGDLGPVTERIEQAFHDIVRDRDGGRYARWRTPVYAPVPAGA